MVDQSSLDSAGDADAELRAIFDNAPTIDATTDEGISALLGQGVTVKKRAPRRS